MYCKLFVFFLYLNTVFGKKSFTMLLDTTLSMQDELDVIKANVRSVVQLVGNSSQVDNFILIPFNDPDVGPPHYSATPDGLMTSLNALAVKGGQDCPENSMDAIQEALEVSNPESHIYVFTDAFAKDNSKLTVIENLCKTSRSQVVIFLSGRCLASESAAAGGLGGYYDVARACAGAVLQFEPQNLRQAFLFMKEITKTEWNDFILHDTFTEYKEFTFSVDSFTTELMVTVYGDCSPTLQVLDTNGDSQRMEKIVDTRYSLVARLSGYGAGEYRVRARCPGSAALTLYRRNEFPYQYGFSTKVPKSMKETSSTPIPGRSNYIVIHVPRATSTKLHSIELHMLGENDKKVLLLQDNDNHGLYIANAFFAPETPFRISVSGQDSNSHQAVTGSTRIMEPQKSGDSRRRAPAAEIIAPDTSLIEFGATVTVPCRVTAYPRPDMWWEAHDGTRIASEDVLLEIPSVHISYGTIRNITKNETIYCKVKNLEGEDSQALELFVKRTYSFEIIQAPRDETFEYGAEGKLMCEVNAYPEAQTKWYHNDKALEFSEDNHYGAENNKLIIRNMSLADVGIYKCEVANEVERKTFTAEVKISGLETPEVYVISSEIVLKPGDWTDIECNVVRGKPTPDVTWTFRPVKGNYFDDMPEGVYVEGKRLKIPTVKKEQSGVYRCAAENLQGKDYRDVVVRVQYAPKIINNEVEALEVKEGDAVALRCEVDAAPPARVRWEMIQDDVIMAFDHRHVTDEERNTHRFEALWKDSGNYNCIAENDLGRDEKTIRINVLVAPYIEPPEHRNVTVSAGATVRLPCTVLVGNPVPATRWEFVAADSTTTVLSRGNSSCTLHLKNVSEHNQGAYLCITDNAVGSDSIRINLTVR